MSQIGEMVKWRRRQKKRMWRSTASKGTAIADRTRASQRRDTPGRGCEMSRSP
ncbi:MAG: hypothetical protein GX448_07490 [Planctomycetes bacterium]|nr:hypothetical protein [Planctomycetota bacterium]